jgi:hypothetical protein
MDPSSAFPLSFRFIHIGSRFCVFQSPHDVTYKPWDKLDLFECSV